MPPDTVSYWYVINTDTISQFTHSLSLQMTVEMNVSYSDSVKSGI